MKIPRWLVRIIKPVVQEVVREAREQAQAEVDRRLADRLRREMGQTRTFGSAPPPPT